MFVFLKSPNIAQVGTFKLSIAALTKYYSKVFPTSNTPGVSLLDLCSSWVSVDYLTKPMDVFKEMSRILKPGDISQTLPYSRASFRNFFCSSSTGFVIPSWHCLLLQPLLLDKSNLDMDINCCRTFYPLLHITLVSNGEQNLTSLLLLFPSTLGENYSLPFSKSSNGVAKTRPNPLSVRVSCRSDKFKYAPTNPARDTRRMRIPSRTTGHRNRWMHSLSGFEASQIPAPIIGIEHRRAMKFKTAVMLVEQEVEAIQSFPDDSPQCGGGDPFAVLGLIEPWQSDDETASILLSHLLAGCEEDFSWPSQVLCSVILPKLLVLREPTSRVLVTVIIEYCKIHQRATVDALLFPLILHVEGINTPICDVVTRIIRECLHPAHVSAFFQKLLCGEKEAKRFVCLPYHECLIANELVWTEPLFTLLQNVLNHNVYLTQDSVDHIVSVVQELAERFSKSLKFTNFLLCFVTKCAPLLKSHKLSFTEAVERTNTFMTNSILSKLAGL
ncbi:hypothetical protein HHK36_025516 [Tetracentron sinense]|uniref:Fanconi Anaemia group E protein C-terminal domain-containing protein n=1 Tax=Tetracentron sinense TaxID=13715 RepID=A0A834YNB2_TETSI|nr:hypothetical protein HHK36_025516 [Tetracentron sinense]